MRRVRAEAAGARSAQCRSGASRRSCARHGRGGERAGRDAQSASALAIPGMQMAGKTGTSQVFSAKTRASSQRLGRRDLTLCSSPSRRSARRVTRPLASSSMAAAVRERRRRSSRRDDRIFCSAIRPPGRLRRRATSGGFGSRRRGGRDEHDVRPRRRATRNSAEREAAADQLAVPARSSASSPWSAWPRSTRWRAARLSLGPAATWCVIASGSALLFTVALVRYPLVAAFRLSALFRCAVTACLAPVIVSASRAAAPSAGSASATYSFQPSEMMKIALVLALARYYQWLPPEEIGARCAGPAAPHDRRCRPCSCSSSPISAPRRCSPSSAAASVPRRRELVSTSSSRWSAIIVVLPHVWERLHDYQKERILTFINPERDPLGAGYHILQSKIAIGSGGIFGKGFMQGTPGPSQFPAREAHRFHLHHVRRGNGLHRRGCCC